MHIRQSKAKGVRSNLFESWTRLPSQMRAAFCPDVDEDYYRTAID